MGLAKFVSVYTVKLFFPSDSNKIVSWFTCKGVSKIKGSIIEVNFDLKVI